MDSYHFKHIICNLYVQKIYIFWFPRAGDFVLKNSHYNTKNTPKNCWFHFDFSQRRNHPKMYLFLTCCTLESIWLSMTVLDILIHVYPSVAMKCIFCSLRIKFRVNSNSEYIYHWQFNTCSLLFSSLYFWMQYLNGMLFFSSFSSIQIAISASNIRLAYNLYYLFWRMSELWLCEKWMNYGLDYASDEYS